MQWNLGVLIYNYIIIKIIMRSLSHYDIIIVNKPNNNKIIVMDPFIKK